MKTLIRAAYIIGIAVLFASCSIFVNKKSEPSTPARNETASADLYIFFHKQGKRSEELCNGKGFFNDLLFSR